MDDILDKNEYERLYAVAQLCARAVDQTFTMLVRMPSGIDAPVWDIVEEAYNAAKEIGLISV